MPAALLIRTLAAACSAVSLGGCALLQPASSPVRASDLPNAGLARLVGLTKIAFVWESQPTCKLEAATGVGLPETGWEPLAINALAGQAFDVSGMHVHRRGNTGPVEWLAIAVQDGPQRTRWIRNRPTEDDGEAAQHWRCALGAAARDALVRPTAHRRVRLALGSAACSHFVPVLGGPEDVSILPYDVGETSVFVPATLPLAVVKGGETGAFLAIQLKSTRGDGQLTVAAPDLEMCFEAAEDVSDPLLDDVQKLAGWLDGAHPDATETPAVSSAALHGATGVDLTRCSHEGDGPAEHYECVVPSLRIVSVSGSALGDGVVELVRERAVDAVHSYGGKLVPATDVVSRDVLVRTRALGGNLAAELSRLLDASAVDPARQTLRARSGWRLMRAQDVTTITPPTHTLDLDVTYSAPPVETVEVKKERSFVAGTKSVPNWAFYAALREYNRVRAELTRVMQAGGIGGPDRLKVLQQRLEKAKARVDASPKERTTDDVKTFVWSGKVLRRKGAASVKATLRASDAAAPITATFEVPFEVSDAEDAGDPAHGLIAKPARPPTARDVERVLADALLGQIDDLVARWTLQAHLGVAAPSLQVGSRAWAAAAARRAVNDRPIVLVSDWREERPKFLGSPLLTVAVELPADAASRCFVFTAIPTDPKGEANLVFGIPPAQSTKRFVAIGRDARQGRQAAFELCGVPPGRYALGVWAAHRATEPGFVVSVFESTAGRGSEDTLRAAMAGVPAAASGDEAPVLSVVARP
jgi:hypothetical protein